MQTLRLDLAEQSAILTAALADVLQAEDRHEARQTAADLTVANRDALSLPAPIGPYDTEIQALLANSPFMPARQIALAQRCTPWGANPIASKLTTDFSTIYLVATLIGPDGPLHSDTYRAGLFYQRPNTYYALHSHDAVETYTILAGSAVWTAGTDTRLRQAGDQIHHPSALPHAFRAGPQGFVALWRWSGDITVDSYQMLPDPAEHTARRPAHL